MKNKSLASLTVSTLPTTQYWVIFPLLPPLTRNSLFFFFLRLSWNSLCRPGWPRTYKDIPASTSWVLGLMACATTTWIFLLLLFLKIFLLIFYVYSVLPGCQKREPDLITYGCEPPCSCWELNSGPLEEQLVLLTSDHLSSPPWGILMTKISGKEPRIWYKFLPFLRVSRASFMLAHTQPIENRWDTS